MQQVASTDYCWLRSGVILRIIIKIYKKTDLKITFGPVSSIITFILVFQRHNRNV